MTRLPRSTDTSAILLCLPYNADSPITHMHAHTLYRFYSKEHAGKLCILEKTDGIWFANQADPQRQPNSATITVLNVAFNGVVEGADLTDELERFRIDTWAMNAKVRFLRTYPCYMLLKYVNATGNNAARS